MLAAYVCFNKEFDPTEFYFPMHVRKKHLWLIDISQKTRLRNRLRLRENYWDIFSGTIEICSSEGLSLFFHA